MTYKVKPLTQTVQDYKPWIPSQQRQVSTYVSSDRGWHIKVCSNVDVAKTLKSELLRAQEYIDGNN